MAVYPHPQEPYRGFKRAASSFSVMPTRISFWIFSYALEAISQEMRRHSISSGLLMERNSSIMPSAGTSSAFISDWKFWYLFNGQVGCFIADRLCSNLSAAYASAFPMEP